MQKQSIDETLAERGGRYGRFEDHADLTQTLKTVIQAREGWNKMSYSQRESTEMIMHKVARIINGDPNYDDSWRDIAGYATLIVDQLNGKDT